MTALFDRNLAQRHFLFEAVAHLLEDFRPLVLHVFQAFPGGIAVDHRVDHVAGLLVEGDMDGVGVAEEVMQIAEDLLVSADEEEADVIIFVLADLVQGEELGAAVLPDEAGDLAVGIAGDVGDRGHDIRLLVEALQRHDREELVDGPGVGDRLEQGKVGEIGLAQRQLKVLQLLRDRLDLLDDAVDLAHDLRVEPLGHGALVEAQVAKIEEADRFLNELHGVVVIFAQGVAVDAFVDVGEFLDRRRQLLGAVQLLLEIRGEVLGIGVEDIGDQHRIVGNRRPPRFGDDVGTGHPGLVADVLDLVDDVVGVLFDRVVDAGKVARLRAVVVDAEPAADVDDTRCPTPSFFISA